MFQGMICGIDEAGRGPVMGPMVVAGVCIEDDKELIEMEVKDSKRHTPNQRERLARKIKKICPCTLRVISADDIDSLRTQMTLNELEARIFASIINEICPIGCKVYVDSASTDEKKFGKMIEKDLEKRVEVISNHRADDTYPVVSAASICAKDMRDEEIERISRELGAEIGSGYPSDTTTREFLKKWIEEKGSLPPHTRRSWKTVRDLLNCLKNKSLDDF